MKQFLHDTLSSLKIRNYRLYYFGQIISYSGYFLAALAQDWLVLKLTNSGVMLGLVSACQFLPMLLLMPYGGVIADRFSKLKLLYTTQTIACLLSLGLGILVLSGSIQVWMVFVFAVLFGLTSSVDNPTRQSFVYEMVGKDEVKNAVSLWAVLVSITRMVGPALAGILIATVGIGLCFVINAISYIPVVIALWMIRPEQLHTSSPTPRAKGQIKEGFKYVKSNPILFITLMQLVIIGTITFEWQASMPLFARFVLHGDATTYSIITVATSLGMFIGGIFTARNGIVTERRVVYSAFFLGIVTIFTSFANSLVFAVIGFTLWGLAIIIFTNPTNTILQVNTDPKMRGRVMSFWNMAFSGSTAVGGPIIGWVGQIYGAQWALAVGGIAALVASGYGFFASKRSNLI